MGTAYGIFETKGYAAAFAAAERILAERDVELIKLDKTGDGIISLFFAGNYNQLLKAFEDGTKEARLVGEIVAVYISKEIKDVVKKLLFLSENESLNFSQKNESYPIKSDMELKTKKPEKIGKSVSLPSKKSEFPQVKSSLSTIKRLRREALSSEHTTMEKSNKSRLSEDRDKSQINISKLNGLNVHELRKLARSTSGFPIQGREISKANRKELIVYFKDLA